MNKYLINNTTKILLGGFIKNPRGALLLITESGCDAEVEVNILVDAFKVSKDLIMYVRPDKASISIEQIRQLKSSLTTKISTKNDIGRIVVIKNAEQTTIQAQNAILKLIEEPPEKTCLIIETSDTSKILDTIVSRCKKITSLPISEKQASTYAKKLRIADTNYKTAFKISNGNPQLFKSLLENKHNETIDRINMAKVFLSSGVFERLKDQNQFSKKEKVDNLLDGLKRVSEAALHSAKYSSALKWSKILKEIIICNKLLENNTSTKLVYLRLCVSL